MKKENNAEENSPLPKQSWGYGYATFENTPNRIIGKIITITELLGLTKEQQKSLKDLVHQSIWDIFHEDCVFITPERHNEIREAHFEMKRSATENQEPASAT